MELQRPGPAKQQCQALASALIPGWFVRGCSVVWFWWKVENCCFTMFQLYQNCNTRRQRTSAISTCRACQSRIVFVYSNWGDLSHARVSESEAYPCLTDLWVKYLRIFDQPVIWSQMLHWYQGRTPFAWTVHVWSPPLWQERCWISVGVPRSWQPLGIPGRNGCLQSAMFRTGCSVFLLRLYLKNGRWRFLCLFMYILHCILQLSDQIWHGDVDNSI